MRILRHLGLMTAILVFALTANGPAAHADSLKEATAAFAKKQYAAAIKLFRPLAEKGNAIAQYKVAVMHRMGLGVPKSEKEARKWSRLAAKQGNPQAQTLLGVLYYKASGEESPDTVRAYMWYEVAAAQGNAEAKKDLALLTKELTPQQVTEAREKAQKCKSSSYEQCD
ncbi:tetratricopeptide repeat protein [Bradyrhizobium sp. AUGA SZCCT0431]|uniref:tetratricopeptide repeat protein n=1 Tax=Bradyrhizobium sp. AUGA SZCCT0431 TaxID=2807674 RepID=UPI0028A17959|nr:tetratricopeptide repeat protein [Bradyrhizobium sp. AUGA SZCCT0431]